MSLGDKNRGALVTTPGAGLAHKTTAIARPTGAALNVLRQVAAKEPAARGKANIGFVIDATGSRSKMWKTAIELQSGMFNKVAGMGEMKLRLIHYGGNNITANEWETNPQRMAAQMAEVKCEGGRTQINDSLSLLTKEGEKTLPNSVIIVGDCYEEDLDQGLALASDYASRKIKIFTFLDGEDDDASTAFKALSERTGGKFAAFGPDMPLNDLCEGVALMTMGGTSALSRLNNRAVQQLLLK